MMSRTMRPSAAAWTNTYTPATTVSPSAVINPELKSLPSVAIGEPDTRPIVTAASSLIADNRWRSTSKVAGSRSRRAPEASDKPPMRSVMSPDSCCTAVCPGYTTNVVVGSSTNAGPTTLVPAGMVVPS